MNRFVSSEVSINLYCKEQVTDEIHFQEFGWVLPDQYKFNINIYVNIMAFDCE